MSRVLKSQEALGRRRLPELIRLGLFRCCHDGGHDNVLMPPNQLELFLQIIVIISNDFKRNSCLAGLPAAHNERLNFN